MRTYHPSTVIIEKRDLLFFKQYVFCFLTAVPLPTKTLSKSSSMGKSGVTFDCVYLTCLLLCLEVSFFNWIYFFISCNEPRTKNFLTTQTVSWISPLLWLTSLKKLTLNNFDGQSIQCSAPYDRENANPNLSPPTHHI